MDTRQLAAFCAVVDRRSFSQAAEQLGVTQPAVSLQIRSLEKRLGQRLLDRSGRRVEPTEAGQRLYRSAQRLLATKVELRKLQQQYADSHLNRLAGQTVQSIETSSLHLDIINDFKRINSHICSVAYPILEQAGALQPTRLREDFANGAAAKQKHA